MSSCLMREPLTLVQGGSGVPAGAADDPQPEPPSAIWLGQMPSFAATDVPHNQAVGACAPCAETAEPQLCGP